MSAALEVVVPKLGLTMEEGTVVEWHRDDGARVAKGEPLFTIETDKVTYEVAAEADGFLQRLVGTDATLPVGATIGRLHASAEAATAAGASPRAAGAAAGAATTPVDTPIPGGPGAGTRDPAAQGTAASVPVAPPHPAALGARSPGGRLLISPVARRLVADRGLDPGAIPGTGPGGAILKRDVEAALVRQAAAAVPAAASAPGAAAASHAPARAAVRPSPAEPPARRPLAGMRRSIAQRMSASLAGSAQMTAFGRIDMGEAVALRARLVADADALGARITYTDLVLKCVATVLRDMPEVRGRIEGDEIVVPSTVDVGLAVALDEGLIVPVIRDVDRLSLVELSRARQAAIDAARAGRCTREDLDGGSFTLSNFGSYGGDFETPILNPPQSAMLGIGRIADDVVARDGVPAVRPMMWISMTFDHRLIDGATAGRFRARLRALLESPSRLLATLR